MIKLSIVTITKNNFNELNKTFNSIKNQTFAKNIELIIVNGGKKIKKKIKSKVFNIKIINYKSPGIYKAMNIGLSSAKGNHVLFLNSGDKLHNSRVIETLEKYSLSKYFSYFFISKVIGKSKSWNIPNNVQKILPGDSVPVHQSILFNKQFYKKNSYNTDFSIAADYEYKLLLLRNYKVLFIPYVVSNHMLGGISSTYTLKNYITISKELFKIDKYHQSFIVLLRNQVNLLIKFILYQIKLNTINEVILSKIYSNRSYEVKI